MQTKQLTALVKKILVEVPVTRDNDYALTAYILDELGYDPRSTTTTQTLRAMSNRQLPAWHSIERARRKVQQDHPALRGAAYEARQRRSKQMAESYT